MAEQLRRAFTLPRNRMSTSKDVFSVITSAMAAKAESEEMSPMKPCPMSVAGSGEPSQGVLPTTGTREHQPAARGYLLRTDTRNQPSAALGCPPMADTQDQPPAALGCPPRTDTQERPPANQGYFLRTDARDQPSAALGCPPRTDTQEQSLAAQGYFLRTEARDQPSAALGCPPRTDTQEQSLAAQGYFLRTEARDQPSAALGCPPGTDNQEQPPAAQGYFLRIDARDQPSAALGCPPRTDTQEQSPAAQGCSPRIDVHEQPLASQGCVQKSNTREPSVKRKTQRKNPWGNSSYADLITEAILSSPEKRLTLSQIYDWMVRNIPHFSDQGGSNSSAGWKNSIRHNLSLHSRFHRCKNDESSGKSSWWTVVETEGTGKTTRRKTAAKKKKSLPTPQRSLISRLSSLSSASQSASSSNGNNCNLPTSTVTPRLSYSSTSPEDNESLQSSSSSASASSSEGETLYRESFHSAYSASSSICEYQPLGACNGQFSPSCGNASLLLTSDAYNCNPFVSNSFDKYYPSGDNFYNSQATFYENNFKAVSVEENAFPVISTEYFKIPHHLSGSYMTSEVSKVDSIHSPLPVLENSDLSSLLDLSSNDMHQVPNLAEPLDFNLNTALLSSESPDLVKENYTSECIEDKSNNIVLNCLDEQHIKNESSLMIGEGFAEKKHSYENNLNHVDCCYEIPPILKSDTCEDAKSCVMSGGIGFPRHMNTYATIVNQDTICGNTANECPFSQQSTYVSDQGYLDQLPMNYSSKIEGHDNVYADFPRCRNVRIQQSITEIENQLSQQNQKLMSVYDSHYAYWEETRRALEECLKNDYKIISQNELHCSSSLSNYVAQLSNECSDKMMNLSLGKQDGPPDTAVSITNADYLGACKRKSEEFYDYSTDVSNASSPVNEDVCSPKRARVESTEEKSEYEDIIRAVMPKTDTYKQEINESDETGKISFSKLDILIYHVVKLVLLRVEKMELSKSAVDIVFAYLHSFSQTINRKKLLLILTELLFVLNSTAKYKTLDGLVVYLNENTYYARLLLAHFGGELDLRGAFCLYANVLDAYVSEEFVEKIICESRIKDTESLPDIFHYLQLYISDIKMMKNRKTKDVNVKGASKDSVSVTHDFVLPSECYAANANDFCAELNTLWGNNNNETYVRKIDHFIRRRFLENSFENHSPFFQSNLNMQNFLAALKLRPKSKAFNISLIPPLKENSIRAINLNGNKNFNAEPLKLTWVAINLCSGVLPNDLDNIEVMYNFDLAVDYGNIDFEFPKYDTSYDAYL